MTGKGFVSLTLRPKPPLLSRLFDNFSFRTSMGRSRYAALAKLFVCATLRISLLFDRTCTHSCAKSFVFKTRGGEGVPLTGGWRPAWSTLRFTQNLHEGAPFKRPGFGRLSGGFC